MSAAAFKILVALVSPTFVDQRAVQTGQHSKIEKATYSLVTNQEDLTDSWRAHLGLTKAEPVSRLEVAFRKHDVVAIHHGNDVEADSLSIQVVSFVGHRFVFYQQRRLVAIDRLILSEPYVFVVLDRSIQPVVVLEGVRGDFGRTERWKVRAVLLSKR